MTFTVRSAELPDTYSPISSVSVMRSVAIPLFLLTSVLMAPPLMTPASAAGPNVVKGLVDAGEIMAFEPVRNRIVSQTPGDYIGAEFDAATKRYRFRFLVEGNVVNVDVDARTGQRIIARQSF
ncbi:MAG: hypothetical protein H7267_00685 [Sandarakinorhabdus sp.]|nr:hypothetical protein [Sandarakinorhabdus sp.]